MLYVLILSFLLVLYVGSVLIIRRAERAILDHKIAMDKFEHTLGELRECHAEWSENEAKQHERKIEEHQRRNLCDKSDTA